ncbi:poly [ADP-ribose] polymerase tankyrase-like isoform X2 [Liolophura sinensis]|uniref:poly [ADP-ribose] polymerase tankyrase-like isoform X2 n=1 Tax=Liolophura sinensis TaxID=3198878 RepID=UPI0031591B38
MEKAEEKKSGEGTSTKTRTKRVYNVEPRTPLKRQRIPVQRFQSPAVEETTPKSKNSNEDRVLLFKKGNFLSVRNEKESFFLCKAIQNVYKTSRNFKVQWLSLEQNPNIYKLDYFDHTELECVLSNVRMERIAKDTYRLPHSEQTRAEGILKKALNVEKGLPIDDGVEEVEEVHEEDEEEAEEEKDEPEEPPKAKKSRMDSPKRAKQSSAKAVKASKGSRQKVKVKSGRQKRKAEAVEQKRKGPDRHLQPDPRIRVLDKEPFFETKEKLPFISKQVEGKLAIRAVLVNDMVLLKSLKDDHNKVYTLDCPRSVANPNTALHYALERENKEALQLLVHDYFSPNNERIKKGKQQSVLLDTQGTGRYNYRSLGVQHIQSLTMGRGSREGNNAFTKDLNDMRGNSGLDYLKYLDAALKLGVSIQMLHNLVAANKTTSKDELMSSVYCKIHLAVLHGHRKLAGKLVEEAEKLGGFGFNFLHKEVLCFEKEDLRASLHPASVKKKPLENFGMTPLHCAAINPNIKYLSRLLSAEPDYNLPDKAQRRPIHYASVCKGSGPLEYLLGRGASPHESDTQGMTPLHFACQAGRVANVEILLKKAKSSGSGESDFFVQKYGIGGMNRPNRASLCPIHIAVEKGYVEVVRCLIKYKVEINKPVSAGKEKLTPLMMAACRGHLDIVRILVESSATIEQADKMKRTALIHAVMNGNAHIASYLLRMGADANRIDSSGNSVVHYAAAYGWYFCVKLLLENANADPNKENDWKVTPVAIAFLKGHLGLVDYLLGRPGVDINFKDDKGMTLVSIAAASPLVPGLYEQLKFLIVDKGADTTSTDINGYTALHFLSQNNVKTTGTRWSPQLSAEAMEISVKIGELLIDNGCDPTARTGDGQTALMLAVEQANVPLVKLLLRKGGVVSEERNKEGKTLLHLMAEQCMDAGMAPLLNLLAEQKIGVVKPKSQTSSDSKVATVNGKKEEVQKMGKSDTPNHTGDGPKAMEVDKPATSNGEKMDTSENSVSKAGDAVEKVKDSSVKAEDKTLKAGDDDKPVDLAVKASDSSVKSGDSAVKSGDSTAKSENSSEHKSDLTNNVTGKSEDVDDKVPQIARFEALKDKSVREKKEEAKEIKTETGKSVLEKLSKVFDNDGFTPLLRACQKYKGFSATLKQSRNTVTEQSAKVTLEEGKQFLQSLLEVTKPDVNVTVQKKKFTGEVPDNEEDQYVEEAGKCCALHFLAETCDLNGSQAMKLLLKFSPKLEVVNIEGATPLVAAIRANCDQAAELLLEAGANPNVTFRPDKTKKDKVLTPILMAASCSETSVSLLRKLASCGANVNSSTSENGFTPLHYVVHNKGNVAKKLEKLKILLGKGANISAQDKDGMTVLHAAVQMNTGKSDASLELEEFLIEKGANLFARDKHDRLPLHYVFVKNGSCEDTSCLDPVELTSVLTSAMHGRQLDERDSQGQTALHRAAIRGAAICCMHLLQRKADINLKDKDGNTPLSLAVLNKHDSCAIMLIQKGASVKCNIVVPPPNPPEKGDKAPVMKWRPLRETEKEEKKEYSIFQGAIEAELEGVAHMMLDVATDANKLERTTAVEAALSVNKFYVALRLMKRIREPSQLQATNAEGRTLLHTLALKSSPVKDTELQLQIAEMLLKSGVSASRTDKHGCTPLIYAGLQHHYKLGHFILEKCHDVKPEQVDKFGRNAMAATFWNIQDLNGGQPEVRDWIEALRRRGCKIDLLSDYPTPDPLLFGYMSLAKGEYDYFVKHSDTKLSPLILAINSSEFDLVQFMLKHGASPSFCDSHGLTPLMHAVKMNDVLMVKLLLNHNFDPENVATKVTGQAKLTRKMSRQLFTISALATSSEQEMPELEKEEKSDGNKSDGGDTDVLSDNNSDSGDKIEEEEEDFENFSDEALSNESDEDSDKTKSKPKKLKVKQRKKLPAIIQKLMKRQRERRDYKAVEKTSTINLSATDRQGWTAIHHLVCPLELGTYDNEEILYVLAKAGAPLLQKDSAGLTPLDHALIRGAPRITRMLQELTGVDKTKLEKPIFPTRDVCDGLKLDFPTPDVDKDSEKYLGQQSKQEAMETNSTPDTVAVPDHRCNIKDTGEVATDSQQNIPYDVLLSKVDVSSGPFGTFNYYKMQIVRQKGKKIYVLFNCWGRIGDYGQFQHTPFTSLEDAAKEFCKVFKSKTGNEWANFKNFSAIPKKYRIVPVEQRRRGPKQEGISVDLNLNLPSRLPPHLQNLLKLMSNSRLIEAALSVSGFDVDLFPLGKIKRSALLEARDILQQIASLIRLNEDIGHSTIEDQYQHNMEKIFSLSNEYYHSVPRSGLEFERLHPIVSDEDLANELQLLNNLLDYERASRILLGAQFRSKDINPLDYIYRALGCQLQLMSEREVETQYILKYIYNSCPCCKVEAVYRVSRPGEEAAVRALNLDNHMLLWHGSGLANFLSILNRGLLIAPPEAPIAGHTFGKGIYFSNSFDKSRHYCDRYENQTSNLMLLSEVALGKIKETEDLGEPVMHSDSKHNSVAGLGQKIPDDTFDVVLPYGSVIPLGPLLTRPSAHHYLDLEYNEYVVHDPSQICLRYLVQFR